MKTFMGDADLDIPNLLTCHGLMYLDLRGALSVELLDLMLNSFVEKKSI
jgi:hypothetical protein